METISETLNMLKPKFKILDQSHTQIVRMKSLLIQKTIQNNTYLAMALLGYFGYLSEGLSEANKNNGFSLVEREFFQRFKDPQYAKT